MIDFSAFGDFMQNPTQYFIKAGLNLPENINTNDPNAIINYLLQSGKISQSQYNQAYTQYRQMSANGQLPKRGGNNGY